MSRPIVIARIGATHGVKGEVRVKPFTEAPEAIAAYGPLRASDGRELLVERMRGSGPSLIVKFEGIDDRSAAEALAGLDLAVERDRLPETTEPAEFYHADLIGLDAVTADGERLGMVVAVHDFGAGDILEIAPQGSARGRGSLLVSFTRETVPEMDLAARRIVVAPLAESEAEGKGD
jgi:16S rRNA processing protein RimM